MSYSLAMKRKRLIIFLAVLLPVLLWYGWNAFDSEERFDDRIFLIGRDPSWYPLNFYGKEQRMVGFTNELVQAIAERGNIRLRIYDYGPFTLLDRLVSNDVDAIFTLRNPTAISKQRFVFSDPVYLAGPVIVVPVGSSIKSIDDLEGKIVAVKRSESSVYVLEKYPTFVMIPYDNVSHALDTLVDNEVDAAIVDVLDAKSYADGVQRGHIQIVTKPLTDYAIRLMAKRRGDQEEFMKRFNQGLHLVKEEGIWTRLIEKWGLVETTEVQP